MSKLSTEEAIKILEDMKIDIPLPKAAVTQIKRNIALDMAVDVLSNCSEFPNNWIPCSERLPEKEGRYLVWAVVSFTPGHVDEPCEYQQTTIASYFYVRRSSWHGENIEKVIAWMPLPEPYGGEQE